MKVLIVIAAGLSVGTTVAQIPGWTQVATASSPGARNSHAMAYDSVRGKVVMFGGFGASNDTWEYDGLSWTQIVTANSPPARYHHAMAYDSVRGRVVMFGGQGPANDTWEYDGLNWIQVTTATGPSVRNGHAMAYDSVRGVIVMFGGYFSGGYFNDTWEYDGVNWAQITTANTPAARGEQAAVYDSINGKVFMFGGYAGALSAFVDDAWWYDGINWTQVASAGSPGSRESHAMVYDNTRQKVVMFGGTGAGGFVSDTWQNDGVNWTQVGTASSPPARYHHAMVYDSVRDKVVLLGGNDGADLNDTWEYDGGMVVSASATTYGTGCGSPSLGFLPTANPVIGTTAGALISNSPTAFGGVTMGWSDSHLAGIPLLPLDLAFIGMPGCLLLHSNDVFGLPVNPLTASTMQFDLSIPFVGSLPGAHVYLQAYCFAPGENRLQIIPSNGIDWLIGNQ